MMARRTDVVIRKIFKLSCFEDCRYIKSCVSLHPIVELVKCRGVKSVSKVVDNQLAFSKLFTFAF